MHATALALTLALGLLVVPLDARAQPVGKLPPQLRSPDEKSIPAGPLGEAVRYGKKVLAQTQIYARAYVGNGLNCTSCHLDAGTKALAAPWVGLWGVFPEYRARNAQVNALQDRVNDCFERSMNGKPLPLGAGMARLNTAAAFTKANMPRGQENNLTSQEALDVAAYFTQQPRPDFAVKLRDWPRGDKPRDAPY